MGADATGDGGPGYDGQDRAAGAMHGDDGASFIIPLEFAGDGDTVGEMKVGVVMTEEGLGSEEMENAQMEELGLALLLLGSGMNQVGSLGPGPGSCPTPRRGNWSTNW
jgi:hypothetical protein